MKYIVYQTTNLINGKIYIGVHKIKKKEDDGYLGCGVYKTQKSTFMNKKTAFLKAIVKYGSENFKRITLKEFETKRLAYKYEKLLVDHIFISRQDTYNMCPGGKGGVGMLNKKHTLESKNKISITKRSQHKGKKSWPSKYNGLIKKEFKLIVLDVILNKTSAFLTIKDFLKVNDLNYNSIRVGMKINKIFNKRHKIIFWDKNNYSK